MRTTRSLGRHPGRERRRSLVLACALGLTLVAAPDSGAHVYWTNNDCDLPVKGSAKKQSALGKTSLRFRGRLSGHKLKRGRYSLVTTATDAAGNRSKAKRVKFTIVKR